MIDPLRSQISSLMRVEPDITKILAHYENLGMSVTKTDFRSRLALAMRDTEALRQFITVK